MSKQIEFTQFSVFLKRVSLLNPQVRTNFVAFPIERTRKEPRSSVRFWAAFGSSREGTELDWTYFKQFPLDIRNSQKFSRGFDNCDSLVQELYEEW